MIWIKAIGSFIALEGGANIIYWYLYGNGVKDNDYWQIGRALRMALGLALIVFG
jgi:hypothetical protein